MPAVGVGYKVVAQEAVSLTLDAGLSEVFTDYYDATDSDSYTGLKGGQALVWKISKTSEFNEKAEITGDVSRIPGALFSSPGGEPGHRHLPIAGRSS